VILREEGWRGFYLPRHHHHARQDDDDDGRKVVGGGGGGDVEFRNEKLPKLKKSGPSICCVLPIRSSSFTLSLFALSPDGAADIPARVRQRDVRGDGLLPGQVHGGHPLHQIACNCPPDVEEMDHEDAGQNVAPPPWCISVFSLSSSLSGPSPARLSSSAWRGGALPLLRKNSRPGAHFTQQSTNRTYQAAATSRRDDMVTPQ